MNASVRRRSPPLARFNTNLHLRRRETRRDDRRCDFKRGLLECVSLQKEPQLLNSELDARDEFKMCINRRSQVLLDGAAQRALRHRPDDGINLLTILEDHHSRDRTNTVLGRDARGFIRVELHLHRRESINRLHRQSLASPFVAPSSSSRRDATAPPPRVRRTHRLELALILLRELIDQRRDHAARTAPRRPKINQHGDVGFQHLALKRLIGHHRGERACEWIRDE